MQRGNMGPPPDRPRPSQSRGQGSFPTTAGFSREHMDTKYRNKYWKHTANANDMEATQEQRDKALELRDKWEGRRIAVEQRLKEPLDEQQIYYASKAVKHQDNPAAREKAQMNRLFYQGVVLDTMDAVHYEHAMNQAREAQDEPGSSQGGVGRDRFSDHTTPASRARQRRY